MKILIVAATTAEIGALIESSKHKAESENSVHDPLYTALHLSFLITGVGMVATAYALGRHLAVNNYDLAVNFGIAGSFDRSIQLGEVVEVINDEFVELGAEDDDRFLAIDSLGFGKSVFGASAKLADYHDTPVLRQVTAITVNTVHGNQASIAKVQQRTSAQLESMEGAAFFYACEQAKVPAMQIRAVSNYVERRNRDAWNIGLAVKNLNTFAEDLLRAVGCVL